MSELIDNLPHIRHRDKVFLLSCIETYKLQRQQDGEMEVLQCHHVEQAHKHIRTMPMAILNYLTSEMSARGAQNHHIKLHKENCLAVMSIIAQNTDSHCERLLGFMGWIVAYRLSYEKRNPDLIYTKNALEQPYGQFFYRSVAALAECIGSVITLHCVGNHFSPLVFTQLFPNNTALLSLNLGYVIGLVAYKSVYERLFNLKAIHKRLQITIKNEFDLNYQELATLDIMNLHLMNPRDDLGLLEHTRHLLTEFITQFISDYSLFMFLRKVPNNYINIHRENIERLIKILYKIPVTDTERTQILLGWCNEAIINYKKQRDRFQEHLARQMPYFYQFLLHKTTDLYFRIPVAQDSVAIKIVLMLKRITDVTNNYELCRKKYAEHCEQLHELQGTQDQARQAMVCHQPPRVPVFFVREYIKHQQMLEYVSADIADAWLEQSGAGDQGAPVSVSLPVFKSIISSLLQKLNVIETSKHNFLLGLKRYLVEQQCCLGHDRPLTKVSLFELAPLCNFFQRATLTVNSVTNIGFLFTCKFFHFSMPGLFDHEHVKRQDERFLRMNEDYTRLLIVTNDAHSLYHSEFTMDAEGKFVEPMTNTCYPSFTRLIKSISNFGGKFTMVNGLVKSLDEHIPPPSPCGS